MFSFATAVWTYESHTPPHERATERKGEFPEAGPQTQTRIAEQTVGDQQVAVGILE